MTIAPFDVLTNSDSSENVSTDRNLDVQNTLYTNFE